MIKKITHLQGRRALRLVYDDYIVSFEDLLITDNSVSIHHCNFQKDAIEMFEVKSNLCPEFIKSLFHQIPRRTRSKALFHRQQVNKVYEDLYKVCWTYSVGK